MRERRLKFLIILFVASLSTVQSSSATAEEIIIQKEKMSFDRCLSVITTSKQKLSITPVVTDKAYQKRIAVFELIDGTLTIECDGEKGQVTVSTNTN